MHDVSLAVVVFLQRNRLRLKCSELESLWHFMAAMCVSTRIQWITSFSDAWSWDQREHARKNIRFCASSFFKKEANPERTKTRFSPRH